MRSGAAPGASAGVAPVSGKRRGVVLAVLVLSVVGMLVPPAIGATESLARGEPDLDVYLPDDEVVPGQETTLDLEIQNDGEIDTRGPNTDRTLSARGVTVEIVDGGPFEVKSGTTPVGTIPDGETVPASQRIVVPDGVEPGAYDLEVEVSYSYLAATGGPVGDRKESDTKTVEITVVVVDEPRFSIVETTTDVEPGTSGDAVLEIENVGSQAANDTRASITGTGGVTLDGGSAEEYLGDLAPGDTATVTVEADVPATTSHGEKPFEAVFTYDDPNGIEQTSEAVTGSLAPAASQSFAISDLADTLSVGYDGQITGELENEGPRPVDDAVLVIEPMSDSLHVEDTRYALPELKPGDSTAFRYPTDVSGSADEGPRQVRFTVEYTGAGTNTLTSDPISERVVVDPRQDEFSIEGVETTVTAGESTDLVLEITNERPEPLSNVDAMLYTDSPLDSDANEAFVPELAPGESAEISFDVSAAEDARATTYPVELDFEYRTERGQTELSDTYQYPVEVVENPDTGGGFAGGLAAPVLALLAIGLGAAAAVWWLRS